VAEDALEGRTANDITMITTLDEARSPATTCCSNCSSPTCSTRSATTSRAVPSRSRLPPTARPCCEWPTRAESYRLIRSTGCSSCSRGSTTAPVTTASASVSPSFHQSPPAVHDGTKTDATPITIPTTWRPGLEYTPLRDLPATEHQQRPANRGRRHRPRPLNPPTARRHRS
jgi:hypothetical protein